MNKEKKILKFDMRASQKRPKNCHVWKTKKYYEFAMCLGDKISKICHVLYTRRHDFAM